MVRLLILPNGDAIDPVLVHGIVKFAAKGVILRNEFNKPLSYIKEADAKRQTVIVTVLMRVKNDRNWEQPDWDEEFATAP